MTGRKKEWATPHRIQRVTAQEGNSTLEPGDESRKHHGQPRSSSHEGERNRLGSLSDSVIPGDVAILRNLAVHALPVRVPVLDADSRGRTQASFIGGRIKRTHPLMRTGRARSCVAGLGVCAHHSIGGSTGRKHWHCAGWRHDAVRFLRSLNRDSGGIIGHCNAVGAEDVVFTRGVGLSSAEVWLQIK
jgi:hypothetical protein